MRVIYLAILPFVDMKLTRNGISFPSTGYRKQRDESLVEDQAYHIRMMADGFPYLLHPNSLI